jgi:hypothetical protein
MPGDERQGKLAEAPDVFRPGDGGRDGTGSGKTTPGAGDTPDSNAEIIRISAWMYLRTIFLLAWSAFRHPFRTTYIDMASGEVVHIRPGEETWGEP